MCGPRGQPGGHSAYLVGAVLDILQTGRSCGSPRAAPGWRGALPTASVCTALNCFCGNCRPCEGCALSKPFYVCIKGGGAFFWVIFTLPKSENILTRSEDRWQLTTTAQGLFFFHRLLKPRVEGKLTAWRLALSFARLTSLSAQMEQSRKENRDQNPDRKRCLSSSSGG